MTYGKTLKCKQTTEFNKKSKINKHFAKIFNIRATIWQTIKQQSIIPMKIGIKPLWATNAVTSVGKPELTAL